MFGVYEDSEREVRWLSRIIMFCVTLLLIPPCANIAILVYARTVSRQEEFAARFVLGASRGRIVLQIFVEVLVLSAAAAGGSPPSRSTGCPAPESGQPGCPFLGRLLPFL